MATHPELSVSYYAVKAGCDPTEVRWYMEYFLRQHESEFSLTERRFATILKRASGRLRAFLSRRQNPPKQTCRKARKRRSAGKQLKRVAMLIEQKLGYRRIAGLLDVSIYTARDYCREVRARGIEQILRPDKPAPPAFVNTLAQLFQEVCRKQGIEVQVRTANGVIQTMNHYAAAIGLGPAGSDCATEDQLAQQIQMFLRRTVTTPEIRRRKAYLLKPLLDFLAQARCQSDPTVRRLSQTIFQRGLPGPGKKKDGSPVRTRYRLSSAVLLATRSLTSHRLTGDPQEDAEGAFAGLEQRRMGWAFPAPRRTARLSGRPNSEDPPSKLAA